MTPTSKGCNSARRRRVDTLQQQKIMSDLIGQSGVFKAKEKNVPQNVVICSSLCKTQGREHKSNLQNDGHSSHLILCKDKDLFTEESLPFNMYSVMYILVDEVLISVLLNKRRAVETVEQYFEGFAEAGNRVYLINNLDDDHKFKTLFYQLPQGCAKIYTEINISQSPKNRSCSPVMKEQEEEVKKTEEEEEEEVEEWLEAEEDDIVGNNDVPHLQVGSHCKMTISAQSKQLVIAKQDGSHNIVNISVEPSPSSSKMVVVMTSNPANQSLEELLVHTINTDRDVLNISLTTHEAAIVGVRMGSVVMEIEVKTGQNMSPDWMSQVLQTILKDILTPDVLGETILQVDINTLNVIPKEELGEYVLLRDPDRKHETCVQKEKYQDLQKTLEATQDKMKELENVRVVTFVNHTHTSGGTVVLVSVPPVHLQDKIKGQL